MSPWAQNISVLVWFTRIIIHEIFVYALNYIISGKIDPITNIWYKRWRKNIPYKIWSRLLMIIWNGIWSLIFQTTWTMDAFSLIDFLPKLPITNRLWNRIICPRNTTDHNQYLLKLSSIEYHHFLNELSVWISLQIRYPEINVKERVELDMEKRNIPLNDIEKPISYLRIVRMR